MKRTFDKGDLKKAKMHMSKLKLEFSYRIERDPSIEKIIRLIS